MEISKQATTPEMPFTFILILDTSGNHGKQLNIIARPIILSWLWQELLINSYQKCQEKYNII